MDVTAIIIAASIPSAITGFCFWLIERNIRRGAKTYGSSKSFTSSKA